MSYQTALGCEREGDAIVLYPRGHWRLAALAEIGRALDAVPPRSESPVIVDGSALDSLDTSAGYTLVSRLGERGFALPRVAWRGFKESDARLMDLVREQAGKVPRAPIAAARRGLPSRIGAAVLRGAALVRTHTGFLGQVTLELLEGIRRPSLLRPRETVSQFEAVCVDAIPIAALVNFLIGVVIAYVLGVEAVRYGANLFVADGVAIGVCRELSPILGSVLVAGRSGAAFTAQIGTMRVEEEVDAISVLGLSPIQVLVIPRLVALVLAMPLLVFVGDVAGIAGGAIVGALQLGIGPEGFLDRVHSALEPRHFFVGLGKAPVFAAFIAMIACRMGLAVQRDARSAGESTTSTVVQCIVCVILIDAAFAVVLQRLEI